MSRYIIRMWTLFMFIQVLSLCQLTLAGDKIRLRDVEVLTLYQGRMTNGRRSSPVPQLKCSGGSARCAFLPQVVQCYNRGSDGYDAQWECKTDMDNKYRFGRIDVNCEGYDHPDDPYILRGSCGLEYTIELTEEGRRASDYDGRNYHHDSGEYNHVRRSQRSGYNFGDLVMLIIVGVIFYMIYSTCTSNRIRNGGSVPPPTAPPPYSEYRTPGADVPPPPYAPDQPGFKREYTEQGSTSSVPTGSGSSDSTSGYGFWSGAASGGLLGYLFGSRNSGSSYYNTQYDGYNTYHHRPYSPRGSGWFGSNWFGSGARSNYSGHSSTFGSSSSGSSSPSSSGSRSASGMGGTSRR